MDSLVQLLVTNTSVVSCIFHRQCLLPRAAPSAAYAPGYCIVLVMVAGALGVFFTHFRVPDVLARVNIPTFRSYYRMGVGFEFFSYCKNKFSNGIGS